MKNNPKKVPVALWLVPLLLLIANVIFFLTVWLDGRYDVMSVPQFLYQMKTSSEGTETGLFYDAVLIIGGFGVLCTAVESLSILILAGHFARPFHKWGFYAKYRVTRFSRFMKVSAIPLSLAVLLFSSGFFSGAVNLGKYFLSRTVSSDFLEKNYVDPEKVELTFPTEKRNLIYIFLESMETTFADPTAGGLVTDNFIPELSKLAEENVAFCGGANGKTGALTYEGSTWTAAAMVTQTAGLPLQVPLFSNSYGGNDTFMPGLYSIGDILEKEGYKQTLLIGSHGGFAKRDAYFTEHGGYEIIDINTLKAEERLPEDYWEWWGYEDDKLFEFAKEELSVLAEGDQPFNFTMLTADTHFPSGYPCEDCGDRYEEQYANVYACSSKKVYDFITWFEETHPETYKNTTIVLCGDHLTMDPRFLADIDENYVRGVYNCIINSAVVPIKNTDREFATFDMFPTTLAAMGVTIPGNRLALGTNLFSELATLTEEHGYEFLNKELQKKSEYYSEKILGEE